MIVRLTFILLFAITSLSHAYEEEGWDRGSYAVDPSTKSAILKRARKQLKAHFSSGKYRFKVQPRWIPSRLLEQSPEQIVGIQLEGEVRRYTNFEVSYRFRGSRKQVEIQLKVEIQQKLPVATGRLEEKTQLKAESLTYQWVSLGRNSRQYIIKKKQLVGKTLRRTLLSGQPVRESDVSRKIIINAGDQVSVIIKRNGVQVQVAAEAREDGARGDRIKVYSKETRKKYVGEVIRPGVLQWKNTM